MTCCIVMTVTVAVMCQIRQHLFSVFGTFTRLYRNAFL